MDCPGTQPLPAALPLLTRAHKWWVKKLQEDGQQIPFASALNPEASCSTARDEAEALHRGCSNSQNREGLVQRAHHLHKDQRFGHRDMGKARRKHNWDKGCIHWARNLLPAFSSGSLTPEVCCPWDPDRVQRGLYTAVLVTDLGEPHLALGSPRNLPPYPTPAPPVCTCCPAPFLHKSFS